MDRPDAVSPNPVLRGRWSQRWPSARPSPRRLWPVAGVSAAVHLGLIGALLLVQALRWVPLPAAPQQLAVIDLVLNDPGQGGAPKDRGQGHQAHAPPRPAAPAAPAAAAPPPVPTPPATQPAAASPAPALPTAPRAALPPPVPDAPPPPNPKDAAAPPPPTPAPDAATAKATPSPTPPADSPPPAVRLGDDGDSGETDEITGLRTAPPGPDRTVHNLPPRYPRGAVLRQEQGQVVMLLHINPAGGVSAADITHSSGSLSLDSAAQEAALAWRFRPAMKDGLPVDSTLPYSITFELTGPRGDARR